MRGLRDGMKILVAYDGSQQAKRALSEAVDIAKRFSGAVTVLHVYEEFETDGDLRDVERTERRDMPSLHVMGDIEGLLKEAGIKYELRSERGLNPPETILRIARAEGFDMIAMGSRGRGGVRAWLLGSVSSKVAAEAPCQVLIAK